MRKIELMHSLFGKTEGKKCKTCSNLDGAPGCYYKCKAYGKSVSEATDWVQKWDACGLYGKEYKGNPIVKMVTKERKAEEMIEGQMSLFDPEGRKG